MGLSKNKVFLPLSPFVPQGNEPPRGASSSPPESPGTSSILGFTIQRVIETELCSGIVVVVRQSDWELSETLLQSFRENSPDIHFILALGGRTRQESVLCGLRAVGEHRPSWVMIHDGARPFCSLAHMKNVVAMAQEKGAAVLATPAKQTLKRSIDGSTIVETVPREEMWEAQTPQVFRYEEILRAHLEAEEGDFAGTDDSQLYERCGGIVQLVAGDERNLKITSPFDLAVARAVLEGETK